MQCLSTRLFIFNPLLDMMEIHGLTHEKEQAGRMDVKCKLGRRSEKIDACVTSLVSCSAPAAFWQLSHVL